MSKETWKDVVGYRGYYQVSSYGRIKSFDRLVEEKSGTKRIHRGRILKNQTSKGYKTVCLCVKGSQTNKQIHVLVAESFLNHVSSGMDFVVDHVNNIKSDNNLTNLQVITQRENVSKNQKNRASNYTGVYRQRSGKKWYASIGIAGKYIYLGSFDTGVAASNAYKNKLKSIL